MEKYFNAFCVLLQNDCIPPRNFAFACKIFAFSLLRFPEKLCRCWQKHLNVVFSPTSHPIMKGLQMNKEFIGGTKGFVSKHVFLRKRKSFKANAKVLQEN